MRKIKIRPFLILSALLLVTVSSCKQEEEESFAWGNFEAEDIMISSEVSGELLKLKVTEGQEVKQGDLLCLIDSTQLHLKKLQLMASAQAVRAGLSEVNAGIRVNEVELKNIRRESERIKKLYKDEAATEKQVDDIKGQTDMAEAKLQSLKAQKPGIYSRLEAYEMQLKQIEDQLERCTVEAPVKGTILETYLRRGELVNPGRSILKMASLDTMILRVFISGDQLSQVETGERVKVIYDGPRGDKPEIPGMVSWISSQAEFTPKIIQTREERVNLVYAVKVLVPNNGQLKIGMPGEIQLEETDGDS